MGSNHAQHVQKGKRMSIADKVCRTDSITLGRDGLREKLGRAPCVESMSMESEGERDAFVNSLELWVRDEVVKETAQECEKEMELEMRILRQQNESLQERIKSLSAAETKIDEMERKRDEMVWELVQMFDGKKELASKLTAIQSERAEYERKVYLPCENGKLKISEDKKAFRELLNISEVAEAERTEQDKVRKELCRRISGLPESCWGKSEEISFPVKILDMGVDIFQAWFSMYMQSEVESYYVGYVYWKVVVACFDSVEGHFVRPIYHEEIPEELKEIFIRQSERLYDYFQIHLDPETFRSLNHQYSYGYDLQHVSSHHLKGDAAQLLHSIVTRLLTTNSKSKMRVEEEIREIPERLNKEIPREVFQDMDTLTQQASMYNIPIPMSLIITCVHRLSDRSPMFVTMIDKYKTPPTGGRNNCGRLLLKMKLEVIEKSRMIESTVSDVQLFWKGNRLISREEKVKEKEEKEQLTKLIEDMRRAICQAKDCRSEVCKNKRGKTKPHPLHPSHLCKHHLNMLVKEKYVPKEGGGYIINKKEGGEWRYFTISNPPSKKQKVGE